MTRPWAAACRLALVTLQLALRPSTAALVVVAGPRELLGLSLTSPPFAFTPETFRVRAPLALVNSADFDYAPGRPDTYRGNQNFSGKIALHVNVPWGSASAEQNARALGALGAVGWAMANEGDVGLFTPVTGYNTHRWIRGDTRSLATPVAVDITSREMLPLIAALRAGKELVAELSPSPFPGRAAYGSWWYWLLSAVVTLQLCIVLELALTKLHAFIRSDGGLHLSSIPQLLLLVEIWLCALRFVFCTIDPFFAHAIVPWRENVIVLSQSTVLSTITSSLFLVFFADAASSSGMASVTIADPRYKRGLLWFNVVAVLWYAIVEILSWTIRVKSMNRIFIILKIGYIGLLFPAVITAMATVTARRVRKALRAAIAPSKIVDRINFYMVRAIVLELAFMVIGVVYLWSCVGSRAFEIIWLALMYTVLVTKSFQHVAAFKPLGVKEWHGPLNTVRFLAARALFKGCGYSSSTRVGKIAQVTPTAISKGDVVTDDLLLGVTVCFLHDFCEAHAFTREAPTSRVSTFSFAPEDPTSQCLDAAQFSVCVAQRDATSSDGRPAISKATHFVSHAQSCSLRKLVDALEGFLFTNSLSKHDTYFWIDVFCLPRTKVQAYVAHIGVIERRIGSVVMVLDPWNAPVCLTRVWCLYEVVHTVPSEREAGTEFHLALPASERARFVAAYKQFGKKHIEKVLAAFDAREAQAAMEADKMMIFRLIASMFNARIPRGLEPRQLITGNGSTPFSNHPALVDDLSFITPESILRNANAAFVRFNEVVRVALMGALTGHSWQI